MQINTLSDLFNLSADNLTLSNATITFNKETNTVQVTGGATVLGIPDQQIKVIFSVVNGQLAAQPQVGLTSITLQQLAAFSVLPQSVYQNNQLPTITFTAVNITANAATRRIAFTGTGPAGNLPLGITALPITNSALYVEAWLASDNTPVNEAAYISGTLQIGQGMAVNLHLPRGYMDWNLQSANTEPTSLSNGLTDLTPLTTTAIAPLLPTTMPGVSQFALAGLGVQFSTLASAAQIAVVQMSISTTDSWTIITDVLSITSVVINLSFTRWESGNTTFWQVGGTILGTIELFDVTCQISIPLPPNGGDWTITTYPNVTIPGIGDMVNSLSQLIGTGDLSPSLPPGLDTLGELTVEFIEIIFNPTGQNASDILKNVAFRLTNENGWALPYATSIQLTNIFIDLNLAYPLSSSQRVVTGALGGVIYIEQFYLPLLIKRLTAESSWTMTIAYTDIEVSLPDLISITGVDGNALRTALPSNLSIVSDLALTALEVDYDLTANALAYASFGIGLTDTWKIIAGYLEVTDIDLTVEYYQLIDNNQWQYLIFLSASVDIANVGFMITAGNIGQAGNWMLTGELEAGETVNLNDLITWLLQQLLAADFQLPSNFPVVVVTDMSVRIIPATGAFYGSLSSSVTWNIPFSQATFQIENLTTTMDIGALPTPPATGSRPYTFTASGNFKMTNVAYLQGTATFSTSSGATPTIIQVEIAAADQLQAADLVNAIVAPTTNSEKTVQAWDNIPVPSDYTKPNYILQAGLQINLTTNTFLVHGAFLLPGGGTKADMYGAVALLVTRPPGDSNAPYTYAVAAALKNWTFAQIAAPLSVIDTILTVTEAAVLLSNMTAQDTAPLAAYVPAIGTTLTNQQGLNFYATLQFGTGLLAQVAQLLGITTQGPFTIKGYIAADATQSQFEASLGGLTLLGFLSFNNITLKYLVQQATTFTLTGDIVVTIDKPYTFHGDLTVIRTTTGNVTTTQANAHITTVQAIHNPLGIPALSLNALFFDFNYIFDGTQSDNQYALGGDVSFSDVLSLKGFIYFKNNTPAVVLIQLANLDIGVFFTKVFGTAWPSDILPIRLKNGMLYYAPSPVSLSLEDRAQNKTTTVDFLAGFRAAADVDIFFIKDFHIDVTINNNGIIATGGYLTPIDWGFIQFYRGPSTNSNNQPVLSDPTKGPIVSINSVTSTFTLSGGFGLFGTPIASLLMSVKSQTINGHITLDQDVPVFGRPSFDFVWDDNGFHVTNWGLGKIKLPDFNFNNLNLDGACPASGIIQIPIRSKVDITPSFSIKMLTAQGQNSPSPFLQIIINGSLNLVVNSSAYASDPLLTANIVNAQLNIPFPATGGFTWDTLGNSFVDCITSAAASIFDNLVKDPQNLAKLLAVEGIVWGIDAVKDFLICEGVDAAAAELFVDGAAGATAVTIGVPILGVVGIIVGGVVGSIDTHGNHHNDGGGHNPDKPRPNAPAAPTLSYNNGQLTASWASVDNASRYAAVIKRDGSAFKQTNASSDLFATVPAEDGHTYTAQIVAAGEGGTSDPGAAASLTVLGHVNITGVSYGNGKITVQWSNEIQNASQYVGQLVDANHTPISPPASATITNQPGTLSLAIDVPAGVPSGEIYVSVQATTNTPNTAAGNIAYSNSSLLNLAAPVITALSYNNEQVTITLQANVAQAASYNVQYLDSTNNTPVGDIVNVPVGTQPVINVPAHVATENYKLQVQAVGTAQTTIPSAWVVSATTVLVPGLLTLTSASYADNNVSAGWDGSSLAQAYNFELRDNTNQPVVSGTVSQPNPQTPAPTTIHLPVPTTVTRGAQYTAYVQIVINGLVGPWSAGVPVTLLDVPQGLTVSYTGTQVQAAWQPVSMASGYTVEIRGRNPEQTRSATTPPVTPPAQPTTSLDIPVSELPVGVYTVVIQATANQLSSAWSEPITLVLLAAPQISSIQYANNIITITWSAVADATSYNVELYNGVTLVASGGTQQNGATPPATQTTLDITTQPKGITYTARVNAGISGGVSAWSQSQSILVLDPPTGLRLEFVSPNVVANWDQVSYAESYNFVLRDTDGGPLIPVRSDIKALTYSLDVSQVPDGNYPGHVQTNAQGQTSAWSAPVSIQVVHPTPQQLASQLHASGVIAPAAAPQIMAVFADRFATNPANMVALLKGYFPESTKTLTQLAWALAKSPYNSQDATQTLSAQSGSSLNDVLAAVKAAYPTPSVQQQVQQLQNSHTSAQNAAQAIHTAHGDVNTLQMAVLLTMNFADTVQTPAQMAQALSQGGYDSTSAMSALSETFPLNSIADFMAAIRAAYPATPQAMAQQLHTAQVIAPDAAPRLKQAFETYNNDAAGFITLLQTNFPESATTLTQLAWALGASGYSSQAATTALRGVSTKLADVIGAVKAAYPDPATQQQIQQLINQKTSAADAAAQLYAANQSLNALQMAVLLMMNFRETVQTPTQMVQALKAATYSKSDVGNVLPQIFPLSATADLTTALDSVYGQ